MRQGSTSSFSFFCGGTILDATTILTAAHCYDGKDLTATDFFIAAGATHVAVNILLFTSLLIHNRL